MVGKYIKDEVKGMNTIKIDNKNVKMVAHRGLSGLEKENTCAALDRKSVV